MSINGVSNGKFSNEMRDFPVCYVGKLVEIYLVTVPNLIYT